MSKEELKDALRQEAARNERFKGRQMLGLLVGFVLALPVWQWSWLAACLVLFGVAGVIQAMSKDNPENSSRRPPAAEPLNGDLVKRFSYVDDGKPVVGMTTARRYFSHLYRAKFPGATFAEYRDAEGDFRSALNGMRDSISDDKEFATEQLKAAKEAVKTWAQQHKTAAPGTREEFDARKGLELANADLESAQADIDSAIAEKKKLEADLRAFVDEYVSGL